MSDRDAIGGWKIADVRRKEAAIQKAFVASMSRALARFYRVRKSAPCSYAWTSVPSKSLPATWW